MIFKNPSLAGKISQKVQSERRIAGPAPDYPPVIDPETMAKRITVEAFWPDGSSQKHVIELYPCRRGRRDQYKAAKDGKPWRDKISLTRLCVELRKTI